MNIHEAVRDANALRSARSDYMAFAAGIEEEAKRMPRSMPLSIRAVFATAKRVRRAATAELINPDPAAPPTVELCGVCRVGTCDQCGACMDRILEQFR